MEMYATKYSVLEGSKHMQDLKTAWTKIRTNKVKIDTSIQKMHIHRKVKRLFANVSVSCSVLIRGH